MLACRDLGKIVRAVCVRVRLLERNDRSIEAFRSCLVFRSVRQLSCVCVCVCVCVRVCVCVCNPSVLLETPVCNTLTVGIVPSCQLQTEATCHLCQHLKCSWT